ncbi:MAG: copper homeostasis protein CutC [Duncaniella sp.]|nr:copper homeostasis protein CutC [Duncaniella sp.]
MTDSNHAPYRASRPLLEVCTGDPEGVEAALSGGASRVELCSGLAEGGLTPSVAMIRYSSQRIPTNVLIRPRAGDFVYTPAELAVMAEDIDEAVRAGASGVVIGVLTPDGRVDTEACRMLLSHAQGLENTFHRAFDVTTDPAQALEDIISLGFARVLTSGCSPTALEGVEMLGRLHRQAAGRITILAGAGVNPSNAAEILRRSGADEIHASARAMHPSAMTSSGNVSMGSADTPGDSRPATDTPTVAAICSAISSL